jgi:uncharacterized protein (DUF305 family)
MSTKRRRVKAVDSDEEDIQDNTKRYIREATQTSTRDVVRAVGPKIESAAIELKHEIHLSRDETQYVYKKHHDQATMLAILNRKLEQRDATIAVQNTIIREQARDIRTMRENALGECDVMFGQVNAKQTTLESKIDYAIKDIGALVKEVKRNEERRDEDMDNIKKDTKAIKRLLEDLIERK